MASDSDIPFKEGYLWIPPNGQVKKKAWQKKFCQLFCASKRGVDRLEIYDSEEDSTKTLSIPIVTLEDCIKITQDQQKTQPNVFTVVTKTKIHYFSASCDDDMHDWISAFQSVAFQDTASRQTIEEDNDLYCSSGGDGVFRVTLVSTDASKRCKLIQGEYTLIVSTAALQLRQTFDNNLLYTWPYRYIRRYGQKKRKFTFEAGRKCESGEGTFDLDYHSPQDIFRIVTSRMQSMKQLLSSRDNLLGVGDSQFHHALGMNARSRSPLPPSPTSTTPIIPIPLPPRKPQRKNPPPKNKEPEIKIEPRKLSLPSEHGSSRIFVSEMSTNNYDKLNHFGSTPKINIDPSYSQINVSGEWTSPQVVEDHGGYGMIRKRPQNEHTLANGTEYATVCKPHRV